MDAKCDNLIEEIDVLSARIQKRITDNAVQASCQDEYVRRTRSRPHPPCLNPFWSKYIKKKKAPSLNTCFSLATIDIDDTMQRKLPIVASESLTWVMDDAIKTDIYYSGDVIEAAYECDETGNHIDDNCDKLCNICGVEYSELGHNYTSAATAQTCTSKGYTTHTCTKCGDSYTYSETAVIAHSYKTKVTNPTCDCVVAHY